MEAKPTSPRADPRPSTTAAMHSGLTAMVMVVSEVTIDELANVVDLGVAGVLNGVLKGVSPVKVSLCEVLLEIVGVLNGGGINPILIDVDGVLNGL